MADLANDIRLAVDSGEVAVGLNKALDSVKDHTSKTLVIASTNKKETLEDVNHVAKIANVRVLKFNGTSMDLGAVCGKPFSVSVLSILKPGNSNILKENYE
ncbi:MAG: 50S ribosomal protein L30e [Candidatus Micrarchaeota archaeon]|nr:50S ribosomal protein L30e [Candidatus Micrarchaeota archaeon]